MATIAQMSVARTRRTSTAASKLFRKPNWSGVKAKLNIRLSANGSATTKLICFRQAIQNTLPKEIAIKTYRNVHTGPNSHEGGAQEGLMSCEYQLNASIYS